MRFIKYSIVFLIIFLIDINFIDLISIKNITPDIILILLIFVSLRETQASATIAGFSVGLFRDIFSFSILGLSSLANSIACFLSSFFQRSKGGGISITYLAVVFFIITLIHDRIYQFIYLLGTNQQFFRSFLYYSVPKAIYTTIVALIINFLFHRIIWQKTEL